jgi:hypothetical protein
MSGASRMQPPGSGGGSGMGGGGKMGGGKWGAGPSGECVCPSCGARKPHQKGMPCYNEKCPKCGTNMVRG